MLQTDRPDVCIIVVLAVVVTLGLNLVESQVVLAKEYRPRLSGSLEIGDKAYSDSGEEQEGEDEVLDWYWYKRCWLKYKQKLTTSDYYYFKVQYYRKEYQVENTYNNVSYDLWGNYTHQVTDKLRSKWLVNYREKHYYDYRANTYHQSSVQYQLDYDYNDREDYTVYYLRRWQNYIMQDKDSTYDRISLDCSYQVDEDLKLTTGIQFYRQIFAPGAASSNKAGKLLKVGFTWDL